MPDERLLAASIPVRPAATVMLVRDGEQGLEVFMLQRTGSAAFARKAYVFPGGKVDLADEGSEFEAICTERDDVASRRLGLASSGLAWLVATVRECFEEAGVLLGGPSESGAPIDFDTPELQARFGAARHLVHSGELGLDVLCRAEGLRLHTDRIHFIDHWITPIGESRRFDTRFFLTQAPSGQEPLHDNSETIASTWVRPADALAHAAARTWRLLPPTISTLQMLQPHPDAASAIAWAADLPRPEPMLPRLIVDGENRFASILRPTDPGYDEVIDPEYVIAQ